MGPLHDRTRDPSVSCLRNSHARACSLFRGQAAEIVDNSAQESLNLLHRFAPGRECLTPLAFDYRDQRFCLPPLSIQAALAGISGRVERLNHEAAVGSPRDHADTAAQLDDGLLSISNLHRALSAMLTRLSVTDVHGSACGR